MFEHCFTDYFRAKVNENLRSQYKIPTFVSILIETYHKMSIVFQQNFKKHSEELLGLIQRFDSEGKEFTNGQRNKIRIFDFQGIKINVKSFKIPNVINKIVYRFFRKSKAKRSFEFANILLEKGIGTPQPIAYIEHFGFGLKDSYYMSEHLSYDFTIREPFLDKNFPDRENVLRQFTRFTYELHQKGIEFLDHSPGNTLVQKESENNYKFFLVDLNRMTFHNQIDFETRMKNFAKLTPDEDILLIESSEYAKLINEDFHKVFNRMNYYAQKFKISFHRKRAIKQKIRFWKKKK